MLCRMATDSLGGAHPAADASSNFASAGAALLLVIGEPLTEEHRPLIQKEIAKGLQCWSHEEVDLNDELAQIANHALLGEEGPDGERVIRHCSDKLAVEVAISPRAATVSNSLHGLLTSPAAVKYVIYAGPVLAGCGSWLLQDDVFTLASLLHALKAPDVHNAFRQLTGGSLTLHVPALCDWGSTLAKQEAAKLLQIRVNPPEALKDPSGILQFTAYVASFTRTRSLSMLLQGSDVVGSIRFTRPTLYIFPGCQGDSALFGISGFSLLVNGGYSRRSCYWDIVRHLDCIDAMLLTHLGADNLFGVHSVLQRKTLENVHPDIGHIYMNCGHKLKASPSGSSEDVEQHEPSLLINMATEGAILMDLASRIELHPAPLTRPPTGNTLEPVRLYYKVGHGALDMYVLNPVADSKELKEFHSQWSKQVATFTSSQSPFPLPNMLSISALLVWRPSSNKEPINRILFPGNAPQHKLIEGLEKVKHLDFLKHASCTAADLAKPASTKRAAASSSSMRATTKAAPKSSTPVKSESPRKAVESKMEKAKAAPASSKGKGAKEDNNNKRAAARTKDSEKEKVDKSKSASTSPSKSSNASTPAKNLTPVDTPKVSTPSEPEAPVPAPVASPLLDLKPLAGGEAESLSNHLDDSSMESGPAAAMPLPDPVDVNQLVEPEAARPSELHEIPSNQSLGEDADFSRPAEPEEPVDLNQSPEPLPQPSKDEAQPEEAIEASQEVQEEAPAPVSRDRFEELGIYDDEEEGAEDGYGVRDDEGEDPSGAMPEEEEYPQALPEPVAVPEQEPEPCITEPDMSRSFHEGLQSQPQESEPEPAMEAAMEPAAEAADESPAPEEAFAKEESHALAESPAQEESPAPAESPAQEESPAPMGSPAQEESPAPMGSPAQEESPAPMGSPAEEESPAPADPAQDIPPSPPPSDVIQPEFGFPASSAPPASLSAEPEFLEEPEVAASADSLQQSIQYGVSDDSRAMGGIREEEEEDLQAEEDHAEESQQLETKDQEQDGEPAEEFAGHDGQEPLQDAYPDKTEEARWAAEADTVREDSLEPQDTMGQAEEDQEVAADHFAKDDSLERESAPMEAHQEDRAAYEAEAAQEEDEEEQEGAADPFSKEDSLEPQVQNTMDQDGEQQAREDSLEPQDGMTGGQASQDAEEDEGLPDEQEEPATLDGGERDAEAPGQADESTTSDQEQVDAYGQEPEEVGVEPSNSFVYEKEVDISDEGEEHGQEEKEQDDAPQDGDDVDEGQHDDSSIPAAFEKDETPTRLDMAQADPLSAASDSTTGKDHRDQSQEDTDSIDGRSPDDDKDVDESFAREAEYNQLMEDEEDHHPASSGIDHPDLAQPGVAQPGLSSMGSDDPFGAHHYQHQDASPLAGMNHGSALGALSPSDPFAPQHSPQFQSDAATPEQGWPSAMDPMGLPPSGAGYDPAGPADQQLPREEGGFDLAQWGQPMGLPSPPPLDESTNKAPANHVGAAVNGKPAAKNGSKSKSAADAKKSAASPRPKPGDKAPSSATKRPASAKPNGSGDAKPRTEKKPPSSALAEKKAAAPRSRPSTAPARSEANTTKSAAPPRSKAAPASTRRAGTATSRASPPAIKLPPLPPLTPFYVDLAYIPCHGDPAYCDVEFFKRVRARHYVLSALTPAPATLNALLEGKGAWEDRALPVTLIPTYDNDAMRHWMGLHREQLGDLNIEVAPSASRCTIQLQDHDASCSAYRLEF